ncbi:hypothetical protein [Ureibacillus chungkukjangi]|uniref:hypothetical protein n=1 Tax=Ureibacillus chungkukjangi TaxID=1202712 RepID=UPI0011B57D34|nr:hypothetical protein [Ureibacillus chungkukjangi]
MSYLTICPIAEKDTIPLQELRHLIKEGSAKNTRDNIFLFFTFFPFLSLKNPNTTANEIIIATNEIIIATNGIRPL